MKQIFRKAWLGLGSFVIIFITSILIIVIRIWKAFTAKKPYSWACYLIAVAIPLALVISWNQINTIYPNDDAADYFKTAQQIYQKFESEGFMRGIKASYLHRGWRPILYPLVAVPFLIVSKGNISATVMLTMSFCFLIFLTYTYLLAREFLSPVHSSVCTLILGTTYWVVCSTHYFYSEIWLYALTMAVLYYLKKSNFFSSRKYSILLGMAIGLAVASKPFELFISLGIFFAFFIYASIKKKNITPMEFTLSLCIVFIISSIIISAAVFFEPIPKKILIFGLSLILIFTALPLFFLKRRFYRSPYIMSVLTGNLIAAIWWFPAFRKYLDYAYVGGMGAMAKLYNLGNRAFFDALTYFFSTLGGYPLLWMFVIAMGGFFFSKEKRKCFPYFKFYVALSVPMIIVPVLIMALSPSTDPRRASLSFIILILMTAILALQPGLALPRIRLFLLTILGCAQILMISATTVAFYFPKFNYVNHFIKGTPLPIRGGDPSEKTFQELSKLPFKRASIAALSLTMGLEISAWGERPFDPRMLQGLAEKYKSDLNFGYPWNFVELKEGYEALDKLGYNMILLDVSTVPPDGVKIKEPYSRLTIDLIERWKHSTLGDVGYEPVYQFSVKNKNLLLLKKINPIFSSKENVASYVNGSLPGATDSQKGFSVSGLNDENEQSAWGSSETTNDTIFYITLHNPFKAKILKVTLFSTPAGGHLKDLSVVATNDKLDGSEKWTTIRARPESTDAYEEKITIPNASDKALITIELDSSDPNWQEYKTFGLACFSGSKSYERNYISIGNGVYVRELGIF